MNKEKCEFRLSVAEMEYLRQVVSNDSPLGALLDYQPGNVGGKLTLRLDRDEAEKLRSRLTEQLAAVGFDKDYSPTGQGKMLENLIDRFYLR
jgi:hypothetical protein